MCPKCLRAIGHSAWCMVGWEQVVPKPERGDDDDMGEDDAHV